MTRTTCPKRNKCTELCDEAEKYVSQDTVPEQAESKTFKFYFESTFTIADFKDIEERKTDELIFYFQKIYSMKDSKKKAILSMVFCGIPLVSIARYLKENIRQVYRIINE